MQESRIQSWWGCFLKQEQDPERSVALKEASLELVLVSGNNLCPYSAKIPVRDSKRWS